MSVGGLFCGWSAAILSNLAPSAALTDRRIGARASYPRYDSYIIMCWWNEVARGGTGDKCISCVARLIERLRRALEAYISEGLS